MFNGNLIMQSMEPIDPRKLFQFYILLCTRGSRSYKPHGIFWALLPCNNFFHAVFRNHVSWLNKLN